MTEITDSKPAWLTAKVDQRLALIEEHVFDQARAHGIHVILTPMREGASMEEAMHPARICDNCGIEVPEPQPFYCGRVEARKHKFLVIISFGACMACSGQVPA